LNYIGSKFKLASFIKEEISKVVKGDMSQKVFCDMFSGIGEVGKIFKQDVKQVISNDIEYYSYVLNKNYIQNYKDISKKDGYIDMLNNLDLIEDGLIYTNYCIGSGSGRQYFSDKNGKKIDTIRVKIKELREEEKIKDDLYYFLLSSLLESCDKVANTASIYGSFLKQIKKTALEDFILIASDYEYSDNTHKIYNEDANELIKKIKGDILYLDPPYNIRQYGANYHILNTIALYDSFTPKGITGVRDYVRSEYCKKNLVHERFENLIKDAQFEYVFLSYSNEGIMSEMDIKEIMSKYGRYDLIKKEYKRYRANSDASKNYKSGNTYEYLHILEKIND